MIGNILDHRSNPFRPQTDAVFEPTIHDDPRSFAEGAFSYEAVQSRRHHRPRCSALRRSDMAIPGDHLFLRRRQQTHRLSIRPSFRLPTLFRLSCPRNAPPPAFQPVNFSRAISPYRRRSNREDTPPERLLPNHR